jgi:hypothetical protein
LRTSEQARSLITMMVWLATLLAALGLYQYAYSMPKLRRQYEQDSARVLAANNIPAETDSPLREQFENRLRSVEPLATFALTNSLAGFLAPWLVGALCIALISIWQRDQRPASMLLGIMAVTMATCFMLTKSRTAYLAVAAGLVLLAIYGRRATAASWRLDWRIPAALAGVVTVIALVVVYSGGLDRQVLSEAPKSVLYRVEYWQATARVIADNPLFGCGPGNFQESYALHKLPQASETVADPHNFLLEMWATAGTPAVVFLLALVAAFAVDVASLLQRPFAQPPDGSARCDWAVFGGAAVGLLCASPVATALGYPLEPWSDELRLPAVWLLGVPLLAAAWWLLHPWLARGALPLAAVIVPQAVLAINLLAAGALTFPGVIVTFLVLAPVALSLAQSREAIHYHTGVQRGLPRDVRTQKPGTALITLAASLLVLACLYTEYYPVLTSRLDMAEAYDRLQRRQLPDAEAFAHSAATADALSPEPWRLLAELRMARWQHSSNEQDWQRFLDAADRFRLLNPRHHVAWLDRGHWFLAAWRKSQRAEDLDAAIEAYKTATERYPNRALYHAQLAFALELAGRHDTSRQEAEAALKLDQLTPHREQKLNRQHVADPQLVEGDLKTYLDESAEQTAQRLRNAPAEDMR